MELIDLLPEEHILIQLNETDKAKIFSSMLDCLTDSYSDMNKEEIIEALLAREKLGSPYLPCKLAVPHIRLQDIHKEIAVFATLSKQVDFAEEEDSVPKPTQMVFLILSPESRKKEYLMFLSRLSTIIGRNNTAGYLLRAKSPQEVRDIILLAEQV